MTRRTSGVVLLALVCAATLFASAEALDTTRRLRDRALQARHHRSRSSKAGVHHHLQTLARAGAFRGASKAHAFLDHAMAGKASFEGFEHAYGSGYDLQKGQADAIEYTLIDPGSGQYYTASTADQVLVSEDGVKFSYSEMTAVAGDYWAPKDDNSNIICQLDKASLQTPKRAGGADQLTRLNNAFDDMWSNKKYGAKGSNEMVILEAQLRNMLAVEKAGVWGKLKKFPTDQHGGSQYYEGNRPDALENVLGAGFDATMGGKIAHAIADGNGRALQFNDDHFWTCAQDTYGVGHRLAVHNAWKAGMNAHYLNLGVAPPATTSSGSAGSAGSAGAAAANGFAGGSAVPLARAPSLSFDREVDTNLDKSSGSKPPAKAVAAAKASEADRKQKLQKIHDDLVRAYAMDGFVSHFLSDQFSSGHLRTPRVELRSMCSAVTNGAKQAGMTANVMHDEDNWNCVLVRNERKQVWWACGDHRFFDAENAMNRRVLHDAIAASVTAVSNAFLAGAQGKPDPTAADTFKPEALRYVGTTTGLSLRQAAENTCPLYRLNDKKEVFQRTGALKDFPRPKAARAYGFGSSLRWNMASVPFPKFVDMTDASIRKGELAETDAALVARVKREHNLAPADLTCGEVGGNSQLYRPFVKRVLPNPSNDCCAVAGRATPELVTKADTSKFADKPSDIETKWPSSKDATNPEKRVTYLNKCFVTQTAQATARGAASFAGDTLKAFAASLPSAGQAAAAMAGVVVGK